MARLDRGKVRNLYFLRTNDRNIKSDNYVFYEAHYIYVKIYLKEYSLSYLSMNSINDLCNTQNVSE